jgi:hypothetical protein
LVGGDACLPSTALAIPLSLQQRFRRWNDMAEIGRVDIVTFLTLQSVYKSRKGDRR